MLLSFIVYTGLALSLFFLGRNVSNRELCLNRQVGYGHIFTLEIILSILIFAFISGVRYNVGVDHLSYLRTYNDYLQTGVSSREENEPGFVFITKLFTYFEAHFAWYFGFLASLQILLLYYAFRNNKRLLPYLGLVIILGPYYLSMMNGIRQQIVACAFIFLIEWIDKKKLLPFGVAIFLLSLIHKSVFILLPIYFLLNTKVDFSNRVVNFAVLAVCVILGSAPTWLNMINSIIPLLDFLGYDGYAENMEYWIEDEKTMAWGPSRLSVFAVNCFVIWYYKDLKSFFCGDNKVRMYFILFLIGTCAYNLFANTSHIFLRPVEYFTIFCLPLSAYLLYFLLKSKRHKVQFWMFLILACSYTYITILKATFLPTKVGDMSLYKFFWDYI